jgi:hypothetical protein
MIKVYLDSGEVVHFNSGEEMLEYATEYNYSISPCEEPHTYAMHSEETESEND